MSAVVLLSSGLDSTVNLFWAYKELEVKKVLTFNYGQRAFKKEFECAQKICQLLKLDFELVDITWFKNIGGSSLVDTNISVPVGSDVKIDNLEISKKTAAKVWVPNRNGVFLNIAASFAERLNAQYVIPGFNIEEAQTFSDNSFEYMKALDRAFEFSTQNKVQVKCYTHHMNKTEIVKKALELKVDLSLIWPCYFAGNMWCGECESCLRFKNAVKNNGLNIVSVEK